MLRHPLENSPFPPFPYTLPSLTVVGPSVSLGDSVWVLLEVGHVLKRDQKYLNNKACPGIPHTEIHGSRGGEAPAEPCVDARNAAQRELRPPNSPTPSTEFHLEIRLACKIRLSC